jgi:hypothetical protein
MKPREQKPAEKQRRQSDPKNSTPALGKLDELGIQRGQNAEKGNTVNPRNRRDEEEAEH